MDDRSLEVPATEYDGTTSDTFVPAEMEAGLVRDDLSVEHLAWELLVPVAYVRLLYLHGQATEEQRRAGRRLAKRHVDYFLSCVLCHPEQQTIGE